MHYTFVSLRCQIQNFYLYDSLANMQRRNEVNTMPTDKPRYTIIVDEEMLKKIDDFRFENRFPSRSAATLELIRLGMEQIKKEQEEKGNSSNLE